jgi:hypothetical protein
LYKYDVLAAFLSYVYLEKAAGMTFIQKPQAHKVDEIDGRRMEGRGVVKICIHGTSVL